jgi:hypothetical protein
MRLQPDLREFIELLNSEKVEYVIAGGWAFGFYAHPRFTQDLDIVVRTTPENASRVISAISRFGFRSLGLTDADFLVPGGIIQLGKAPNRIDLLTSLTGIEDDEIWKSRHASELDDVPVFFLDKSLLIKNKTALGRPRDKSDVEELTD